LHVVLCKWQHLRFRPGKPDYLLLTDQSRLRWRLRHFALGRHSEPWTHPRRHRPSRSTAGLRQWRRATEYTQQGLLLSAARRWRAQAGHRRLDTSPSGRPNIPVPEMPWLRDSETIPDRAWNGYACP